MFLNHISDLFQLEYSYFYNCDSSVSFILHVPMVKQNQIYNLYQHIPIPLFQSFSSNLTITSKVDLQYIEIGRNFE